METTVGRMRSIPALRDLLTTRAMVMAVPDLFFLLTREGVYLDYYARDDRKLFVPPDAFLGKNIRDVMPPDLAAELHDAFARVTPSGDPVILVYTLPVATEIRYYETRLVGFGDDLIVSIVRDVTDQKRADAALRRSERALRQSHRRIRRLARRLIAAQEDERSRLARELHDDLSQKLALMSMGLNQLTLESVPLDLSHRTSIRMLVTQASEIAGDVQRLAYALHPTTVATLGVVRAVERYCEEFAASHEAVIDFSFDGVAVDTSPEVDVCAYRVVQEGLLNATKHSGSANVSVRLWSDRRYLLLRIVDEGKGFDVKNGESRGLGLVGMRERVEALGGHFAVRASPGRGTRISVRLPLLR